LIFRLGELFSGPGGLALGAHIAASRTTADITHAWANDYDADTCATYVKNIPGASPKSVICGDVRKLDISSLSPIDAFAFGFPCNDFSAVGEQRGVEGNFGPLYKYGVEVLNTHNPIWFVAENVGGLRNSNDGVAFLQILSALASAGSYGGYKLVPHLYKFEEYGVPQSRHRILIVGIRNDRPETFQVPDPTVYRDVDVTSKSALEVPPIPSSAPNNELTAQSPVVVERLRHILPGQNAFTATLPEHLKLNVKGAKISQIYKRLDPNKPSYTVTGSGGGGTHVYHYREPRALTNRERARLQTFPDDFAFVGSKESVRKQIGMAVPVAGSAVVIEAVLKTFTGEKYPSIESNMISFLTKSQQI